VSIGQRNQFQPVLTHIPVVMKNNRDCKAEAEMCFTLINVFVCKQQFNLPREV